MNQEERSSLAILDLQKEEKVIFFTTEENEISKIKTQLPDLKLQ